MSILCGGHFTFLLHIFSVTILKSLHWTHAWFLHCFHISIAINVSRKEDSWRMLKLKCVRLIHPSWGWRRRAQRGALKMLYRWKQKNGGLSGITGYCLPLLVEAVCICAFMCCLETSPVSLLVWFWCSCRLLGALTPTHSLCSQENDTQHMIVYIKCDYILALALCSFDKQQLWRHNMGQNKH